MSISEDSFSFLSAVQRSLFSCSVRSLKLRRIFCRFARCRLEFSEPTAKTSPLDLLSEIAGVQSVGRRAW